MNPGTAADVVASSALYLLGFFGLAGCLVQAIRALTAAPTHSRFARHRSSPFSVN